MLQPVFDFIEQFATDFTWKRLVISLVQLLQLQLYFFFMKHKQQQISCQNMSVQLLLLKNWSLLNQIIKNLNQLLPIFTQDQRRLLSLIQASLSTESKQALLASAARWLFFCLFFILGYFRQDTDAPSIVGASIAVAIIVGSLGYFIPVEWGPWIGFGIYPFGINFLIFASLMWYGNKSET